MATLNMVTCMLFMFDTKAYMLINLGATHSFIAYEFVTRVGMTSVPLNYHIEIHTLTGESL